MNCRRQHHASRIGPRALPLAVLWLLGGCATAPVANAPRASVTVEPERERFKVRIDSAVAPDLGAVAVV